MSREQLEAHLQLFAELGVEGFRREPEWRTRVLPDDAPVGQVPLDPPAKAALAIFANAADALAAVRVDLGPDCQRCKLAPTRTTIVFGSGNPNADIVFVGEAPGYEEDQQGLPFVGEAGRLLTKIIESTGIKREDAYICNILKCRPPGNRNPEPDEVLVCGPFLKRQIAAIRPKIVCCLGKFAAQTLLQNAAPISKLRGEFHDIDGMRVIATFHPAYLLRSPEKKREVWEDMKQIRDELFRLRF